MVEAISTDNHTVTTRLTQLWDIEVPIIGAPMAGRSGGELAAAVSRAGGLGMFGVGSNATPEWIAENARIAREGIQRGQRKSGESVARKMLGRGDSSGVTLGSGSQAGELELGNFGIGVMVWDLEDKPEVWQAVLDALPKVISLGFGDAANYVEQAHDLGISVVAPVNDVSQVKQALAAEVDVICIQGTDAGGHTGRMGTMPLMQIILDYLMRAAPGVPAAVAGGIGAGRGVAAALAAGADAAWIGTALLGSPEALGSEELRSAAIQASGRATILTDIYDRAEQVGWDSVKWPTRTVSNGFTDVYAELSERGDVMDQELIAARGPGGEFEGDLKLHAGEGIELLVSEQPAEEVIRQMNEEAWILLNRTRQKV